MGSAPVGALRRACAAAVYVRDFAAGFCAAVRVVLLNDALDIVNVVLAVADNSLSFSGYVAVKVYVPAGLVLLIVTGWLLALVYLSVTLEEAIVAPSFLIVEAFGVLPYVQPLMVAVRVTGFFAVPMIVTLDAGTVI